MLRSRGESTVSQSRQISQSQGNVSAQENSIGSTIGANMALQMPRLPDFLRNASSSSLLSNAGTLVGPSALRKSHNALLVTPRMYSRGLATHVIRTTPAHNEQREMPQTATPLMVAFGFGGSSGRGNNAGRGQKRSFSNTSQLSNQNMLAHAERTANNNPTSATAQQAFYAALLRANMPKIVIERYQTGRYANSQATDASYLKALQVTGTLPPPGAPNQTQPAGGLDQHTLQSVGQAVAAHNYGGSFVTPSAKTGTGAKESPLHVIVEESWGASVFRWVKFLVIAAIMAYFGIVVLTMLVEFAGSFRTRVGQNNEVQAQHQTVRFSDVHGCDEAKEELQELVEFLTNPEKFNQLGGKLPKGILLVGPPGTGKTMLARAVAGEAGCPVFYMSGSEFDELYVGVGAKRVRDLFQQARNKAPAIIFIDELDAVGGKRNARDPAYAKQTLNQLLTELDGFSPSTGVILIAATNYPDALDQALTRPGRFDRHVNVPLPDVRGRIQIIKHHMKNVPVSTDVDATTLARATSGMSGADLENLVNQAAIRASRLRYKKVNGECFEWAKDKIMMGAEAKSRVMREKDKIMTAYHEAGHALVNLFTPGSNQLYKMTIIPRGRALGVTHSLPDMDAVSQGYDQYLAHIAVAMGGRAAEELIYGPDKVSSGISSDVSSATQTAFALVTRFGYSPKLGNVDLATDYSSLSSETKQEIEREVRRIVEDGRKRADKIMADNRAGLEALKDALIEFETLDREEILKVLKGEKLQRIQPEIREEPEEKKDDSGGRPLKSPGEERKKKTGGTGGVGIKLPEVLLPTSPKGPESARSGRSD
jgi:ATP-dependent metalloprotease